jgi:hydrogenase small subunit
MPDSAELIAEPTSGRVPESATQPKTEKHPLGPLKVVHAFWLAGMSCDGCSSAVMGAANPSLESLLSGTVAGMPKLVLHHSVLSVEAGEEFIHSYELAARGELGAPYVVIYEGSIADERIAAATGGYFSAMGVEKLGTDANGDEVKRPIPTAEWLKRLAPGASAAIAIGTCATWGGIPAAAGNPTGSMSLMDFLGRDYRSTLGLPVINIPGCSPVGDNFTETVALVLLFFQRIAPLPEFDELGRPAWLFNETVHQRCVRAGFYEEGTFAKEYGDQECLVEVGCWGPVVQCNIASRGAVNHMGGCMNTGGICIGCTMPGFPDRFSPFYVKPPGTILSSHASRAYGAVIRRLRRITQEFNNHEVRWTWRGDVPSGWGSLSNPSWLHRGIHYFYEKWQHLGTKPPGRGGDDSKYWAARRPFSAKPVYGGRVTTFRDDKN